MNYFANVINAKNINDKTILQLQANTDLLPKLNRQAETGKLITAEIKINDNRYISAEQRKKIYATIKDISEWTGDVPEYLKELFKYDFCSKNDIDYFSLSDCEMTVATEFINYLIEFCLENHITLSDLAINRTDDIEKYLYYCIKTRTCAISGETNADIHHVTGSRVGMGRNRISVDHSNLKIIALSREWHNKVHAEGESEIFKKYKVKGITVDRAVLKTLNMNYID